METSMHREVLHIFSLASTVTKPYYLLGQFMDGGNEDNWVIRWMLWNIFRYGMNRRRNPNSDPEELLHSPERSPPFVASSPTGNTFASPRREGMLLVRVPSQKICTSWALLKGQLTLY
ncbi:hypothetical protein MPH_00818 [Macrophomina phaseolina MS6]|uniref:Uncharacterized protein n=1 Tax=Macrophomina phaseolina (strain MS6) TaxID=1126212 RepID=K2S4M2_MACPH|nr:hypothetical protein MPH_00818 [Macrophomina phaseolina MS6]